MKTFRVLATFALLIGLASGAAAAERRILLVDSYHEGYAWSDGIVAGAKQIVGNHAELKIHRMDTKRNGSQEFKQQAAEKVKQDIEAWKPAVVIACDDNAAQYVIVPHYMNHDLPFVFCGLNWDASLYGFPCKNVTGMVEVSLVPQLIEKLQQYAKGKRIGFIGMDNETDRKEGVYIKKLFNLEMTEVYVKTFEEWKAAYANLQDSVDMLMVVNNAGISGWDDAAARAFVLEVTRIPSGTCHDHIAPFVLVGYTKMAEEQGEWAAGAALQILEGKLPADIPIAKNQKGQVFLNMPLAARLKVSFPIDLMKGAKFIKD